MPSILDMRSASSSRSTAGTVGATGRLGSTGGTRVSPLGATVATAYCEASAARSSSVNDLYAS